MGRMGRGLAEGAEEAEEAEGEIKPNFAKNPNSARTKVLVIFLFFLCSLRTLRLLCPLNLHRCGRLGRMRD
jgi:hypothetical protein